jgi:hypothetical protein
MELSPKVKYDRDGSRLEEVSIGGGGVVDMRGDEKVGIIEGLSRGWLSVLMILAWSNLSKLLSLTLA